MKRLEKGEISDKEDDAEESENNEPDYIIEEATNKKKERGVRPSRDDTFVPLNIYDLYE
jgi:hypothetical protein